MKVYLVWDGYDDVAAVFLSEENALAFVDKQIKERSTEPFFHPDRFSVNEMDVVDTP